MQSPVPLVDALPDIVPVTRVEQKRLCTSLFLIAFYQHQMRNTWQLLFLGQGPECTRQRTGVSIVHGKFISPGVIPELLDTGGMLRVVGLLATEQQLEGMQSEMTSQGTQLQEVESQLDMAKQSLEDSNKSLKASQKSAEYVTLLWHLAVSIEDCTSGFSAQMSAGSCLFLPELSCAGSWELTACGHLLAANGPQRLYMHMYSPFPSMHAMSFVAHA